MTIIDARRPVRFRGLDAAHETWSPWEPRLKLVTQMVPRYPGDIPEPETRDEAGMKVIRVSPEF